MIEKVKNHIMHSAEENVLEIDQKDIEQYLCISSSTSWRTVS